jgi:sugar lactone lactonase YvrE
MKLPGFHQMVVDDRYGILFLTTGPDGEQVLVLDAAAASVRWIDGLAGASGLAVTRDGRTLFVALSRADAIAEIHIPSLRVTARHDLTPGSAPVWLALTGDTLWFGYHGPTTWNARIGRLDTISGTVSMEAHPARYWRAPALAASRDGHVLLAAQGGLSPSAIHVYEVAQGTLTLSAASDQVGANLVDAALDSAGGMVFTASAAQDHVGAFALPRLSPSAAYAAGPHPNAVAVRPDGERVAVGSAAGRGSGIRVYRPDRPEPDRTAALGDAAVLADRGLAWAPDGSLFAVTRRPGRLALWLRTLSAELSSLA